MPLSALELEMLRRAQTPSTSVQIPPGMGVANNAHPVSHEEQDAYLRALGKQGPNPLEHATSIGPGGPVLPRGAYGSHPGDQMGVAPVGPGEAQGIWALLKSLVSKKAPQAAEAFAPEVDQLIGQMGKRLPQVPSGKLPADLAAMGYQEPVSAVPKTIQDEMLARLKDDAYARAMKNFTAQ
jgi:hypothetical protein